MMCKRPVFAGTSDGSGSKTENGSPVVAKREAPQRTAKQAVTAHGRMPNRTIRPRLYERDKST
jgi:hypothetical protein